MQRSSTPLALVRFIALLASASPAAVAQQNASLTLDQVCAGQVKIVDLTWPLNAQSAFWPGDDYQPFQLKTIATLETKGVLSKTFSMPEHFGTHLDAPNHFEPNQPSVDLIAPPNLFAPGVMIDLAGPAVMDHDVRLTREHLQTWERQHGQIPEGAVVLLNTGCRR